MWFNFGMIAFQNKVNNNSVLSFVLQPLPIFSSDHFAINSLLSISFCLASDRLCGLVVRVPGYRSRGPGSIPGATRFSEK
jgi:hypothetical protein